MSWYLRFNTTTCYVSIPTGQNADAGQSTWTFGAKLKISAYPSASAGILGTNGTTSKNGFAISNQGALEIWHNNVLRASSPAFVIPLNQEVEIQIGHLISGETAWSVNGSVVHNSTFNTAGLVWVGTNTLNAIGKLSSSDTTLQMDLKEVRTEGMQNSRTWSAPLSGGTGTILPTTNGTNQGTLVNFPTNNSQWVSIAGGTAVSFSGTIPNQSVNKDSFFNLDVSGYFVGNFTPFTYSVETGALPAGLSLNASTGVITGTPTVYGRSSGISIKATDASSFTAVTNTFAITVGPYGVLFDTDSYLFLSRPAQYIETEFMFKSGSTYFSVCGVANPTEENLYYIDINRVGGVTVQTPAGSLYTPVTAFALDTWYTFRLEIGSGGGWYVYINNVMIVNGSLPLTDFLFDYVGYNPAGPGWSNNVLMRRFTARANTVTPETWTWATSNINNASMTGTLGGNASFQNMTASAWTTYVPASTAKLLKYHNGTTWVTKPLKYHNGTAWVTKPLKYHNGTSWS